jgi:hypothetical protein
MRDKWTRKGGKMKGEGGNDWENMNKKLRTSGKGGGGGEEEEEEEEE